MAKRRGRPSRALREQILKQDAAKIAKHFLDYPLRAPVDPQFDPYYRRILGGDLAAVWDYWHPYAAFDASFYELIGRLVPLQFFNAAKQIISEVRLHGADFDTGRGGVAMPPDWMRYQHFYDLLIPLCQNARKFIREKYKGDPSAKREQLWNEYCYHCFPTIRSPQSGLKTLGDLKAWGDSR